MRRTRLTADHNRPKRTRTQSLSTRSRSRSPSCETRQNAFESASPPIRPLLHVNAARAPRRAFGRNGRIWRLLRRHGRAHLWPAGDSSPRCSRRPRTYLSSSARPDGGGGRRALPALTVSSDLSQRGWARIAPTTFQTLKIVRESALSELRPPCLGRSVLVTFASCIMTRKGVYGPNRSSTPRVAE
jgi:hypothetical protein